jgi:hypothetical protein
VYASHALRAAAFATAEVAALPGIVLWIHVICGVTWISVIASLVIASYGLAEEGSALTEFVLRAAPRINRVAIVCASLIVATGFGNLIFTAKQRGMALPSEFVEILSAKIALLGLMLWALWRAIESLPRLRQNAVNGASKDFTAGVRELLRWYALIVTAGVVALGLGLWLAGI